MTLVAHASISLKSLSFLKIVMGRLNFRIAQNQLVHKQIGNWPLDKALLCKWVLTFHGQTGLLNFVYEQQDLGDVPSGSSCSFVLGVSGNSSFGI